MGATASDVGDSSRAAWYSVLRELASPWYIDDRDRCLLESDECLLWLRVMRRHGNRVLPADLGRMCEALRLLELLARVDFDAWVREMFKIWPDDTYRGWVEFRLKPVALKRPLRLGLLVEVSKTRDAELLNFVGESINPSNEYLQAREKILRTGDRRLRGHNDEQLQEVPVCVEHDFFFMSSAEVTEMLQSTLAVVKTTTQRAANQSVEDRTDGGDEFRSIIYEVRSASASHGVITKESIKLLAKFVKRGIRVGNLFLLALTSPRWATGEPMTELFEALRAVTLQGVDDINATRCGVWSVHISHQQSQDSILSLLSAAAGSKCVRDIEIDLNKDEDSDSEDEEEYDDDEDDYAEEWEWVAYHLFSRFAVHNIHFLGMNLSKLKPIEVAGVHEVLAAKNPLAILDGRVADSDGDEPLQPLASKFCVVYPHPTVADCTGLAHRSAEIEDYVLTTPDPICVRVISKPTADETQWWLVAFPGVGIAWVHGDDIHSVVSSTNEDQLVHRPAFPTVIITDISDDAKDVSVQLLELIAHGTTRIELYESEGDETYEGWCDSVLRACPQVEELLVYHAPVRKLEVFVDAAEAGYCRIRELKLQCILTNEPEHTCALFAVLSDPLHPLTTHLEQLDLNFIIEHDNFDGIIDAARRMVEQNRRLQHVRLGFELVVELFGRSARIQEAFASQLEADVSVRVAPLDLNCKCAFLSVVDAKTAQTSAWTGLDSGVMAIIFQFAAVSRDRLFEVACNCQGF